MIEEKFSINRQLLKESISTDIVVVGGGLSGVCSAITAAREGLNVVLVHDRSVLGGNASSEIRLWVLGATSHMGNNNRWAREGGVIDEILMENIYRNSEGNPIIFDTIILDKVINEPKIRLLLNTQAFEVQKIDDQSIAGINAFCSQNCTMYQLTAPMFVDASGDGLVGYLAGAPFRVGAENKTEFNEGFAPDVIEYGELLGHTIYFYAKDTGKPVKFVAPDFALKDITKIPRYSKFNGSDFGCNLWWLESGGRLDTIKNSEDIKMELWKVVYGVWDYIKNSGKFPDVENKTLEWVGHIPGKRESRRFVGEYMLHQRDVIEQTQFADAVAHGGWSIDLHPSDGVYSSLPGCNQWHSKGVFSIPYRCYYSSKINNLFFAGRVISVSHVAFGSTRVMGTCAVGGQAVGIAAAMCFEKKLTPAQLYQQGYVQELQQRLTRIGQFIPQVALNQSHNLASKAKISVSSELKLSELTPDNTWFKLSLHIAQLLPLPIGDVPDMKIRVKASAQTTLQCELRRSSKIENHTPDLTLKTLDIPLIAGEQEIELKWNIKNEENAYYFYCFLTNDSVEIQQSDTRITGLLTVYRKENKAVSNYGLQDPPSHIGVERFEFWTPYRRPAGKNLAFQLSTPLWGFGSENLFNGVHRPLSSGNAWVANINESNATLKMEWDKATEIQDITLYFDNDHDHPAESAQWGHPENEMPFCVRSYKIFDAEGNMIYQNQKNHQAINKIVLSPKVFTDKLSIVFEKPLAHVPIAVFGIFVQ